METRKLSTILFADIAGYTALMQSDERKALSYLSDFKDILETGIGTHKGRIVQFFGDGCLLSFDSTLHGVDCAIYIQEQFQSKGIPVRIGMHLGDVVFKDDNVFGDGVNIASRIETMGVPGAILLSKTIREQIKNKSDYHLSSLGSFEFKNVKEPLEVYALSNEGFVIPDKKKITGKLKEKSRPRWQIILISILFLSIPVLYLISQSGKENVENKVTNIPRLAVLNFEPQGENVNEELAINITDQIAKGLSGIKKMVVIGRESSKLMAPGNNSLPEIGEELGATYLLKGTVGTGTGRDGNPVDIIKPVLYSVTQNKEVWNGTFESTAIDEHKLQGDISESILLNLDIALTDQELSRLNTKLSDNPLAVDAYLKGMKIKPPSHGSEEEFRRAFKMFKQAVSIDDNFAMAWLGLGYVYKDLYWFGYESHPSFLDSSRVCLERAKQLDPANPQVIINLGDYYYRKREYDKAMNEFSKVMSDRPNDSDLIQKVAETWRRQGLFEEAIDYMEKGLEIDPFNENIISELSWTYIFTGNFDRALELQERSRKYNPGAEWNHMMGTLIHWSRGKDGDLETGRKLLENFPNPQSDYPAWFWVNQLKFEKDYEGILRLTRSYATEAFVLQSSYEPISLVEGLAYLQLGNKPSATQKLEEAVSVLEEQVRDNPSDFRMHVSLGMAYAGLGKKAKAINSGMEAKSILPLELDSLLGLDVLYGLMRIYAILGENDLALDVMAKLMSVPCQFRGLFFTHNPEFKNLHTTTRFQDLMTLQNKMDLQFNQ